MQREMEIEYTDSFLRENYRGLLNHLINASEFELTPTGRERRHDHYLRALVENGERERAMRYLDSMIGFCERRNLAEAPRYRQYKERVERVFAGSD
ncbi:MAG: hypothetical protein HRF49_08900 [bacterium]|jgi:hypothetical protein